LPSSPAGPAALAGSPDRSPRHRGLQARKTWRPRGRAGSSAAVVPATRPAWKLSGVLAAANTAGTIPTAFAVGILRGPAAMNGSVRGTALVMLAAGLPVLIMSILAA
jgi:hypothetical protein